MKILLFTTIYPPSIGGVQHILQQISKRLPLNRISVVAPSYSLDKKVHDKFLQRENYNIITNKWYTPNPNPRYIDDNALVFRTSINLHKFFVRWRSVRAANFILSVVSSIKVLVKNNPQVVWCGYPAGRLSLICLFAKYVLKKKMIIHVYGEELPELVQKKTGITGLKNIIVTKAIQKADLVYAISRFGVDLLAKLAVPKEKIILKLPGIDSKRFTRDNGIINKLIKQYELAGKKVLLSAGNISSRKGIDLIVKLMPDLLLDVPELVYLVIGHANDKEYLNSLYESIDELALQDKVKIVGGVSDSVLTQFLSLADVFTLATRENQEGFGMVFVEANACRTPVVGFATGGILDAIDNCETGILVPSGDWGKYKDSICRILCDSKLAESLGEKGFKRAHERFSWKNYVGEFRSELANLIKSNN